MKVKSLLAVCAIASVGGLSVATAEDNATASTEKAATSAAETMKVFIVMVKGGGWGVSRTARAAVSTQEGIKSLKMSGLQLTVVMNDGVKLDEVKLKEEFAKGPVSLVSVEEKDQVIPKAGYNLVVSGAGWATTNDKARVALEALPGVAAAYVNENLEIYLIESGELDEKSVKEVLSKYKMEASSVKKMEL